MSPAQTLYQFVVGCLYSLIIIYGGNLLYTIIIHFINNFYIVLNCYYFHIVFDQTTETIMTIAGMICLIVGVLVLINGRKEISISKEEKKANKISFLLGAVMGAIAALVIWIQGLI